MSKTATLDANVILVRPAGHVTQQWEVQLPVGIAYADVFKPSIWADIEKLMRSRGGGKRPATGDFIRCISADGSFDATCLVQSVSDGYRLRFYSGIRPAPLPLVLADLDALQVGDAAELKEQATALRKRWAAAGISRDDIASARRTFAKNTHPDTNNSDGQRLAAANAVLDHALDSLPEAA